MLAPLAHVPLAKLNVRPAQAQASVLHASLPITISVLGAVSNAPAHARHVQARQSAYLAKTVMPSTATPANHVQQAALFAILLHV